MHEVSLASALLRQVDALVASHGGGCVTEIRVEVRPLAGIEPLLLREAFYRSRTGTSAADAELVIDVVGLSCRCRTCRSEYASDELRFVCPRCQGNDVDVTSGDAVVLQSFTLIPVTEAMTTP